MMTLNEYLRGVYAAEVQLTTEALESQRKPKPGKPKTVFLCVSVVKELFPGSGWLPLQAGVGGQFGGLVGCFQVKSGSLRPKCP